MALPNLSMVMAPEGGVVTLALRQVCEAGADIQVLGEAGDRREAVELACRIAEGSPAPRVIGLAMNQKGGDRPEVIQAGVWGCPPYQPGPKGLSQLARR
jgi:hypothetical protein